MKRWCLLGMMTALMGASLCFASSWLDGLSTEALDWMRGIAVNVENMAPGTYSDTFDGTTVTVVLMEDEVGDIYAGRVSVSDRGSRTYTDSADALSDINNAVPAAGGQATQVPSTILQTEIGDNTSPLISSETPVASADKSGRRIVQNVVVPRAEVKDKSDKAQEAAALKKPKLIGGTVSYEDFEYFDIDGKTYEVLGGVEQDFGAYKLGFFVPMSYVDATGADWQTLGLTGYIKKDFPFKKLVFSAGLAASGEQTWIDLAGVDDSFAYGAGPMASVTFDLGVLEVGLGASYMYLDNTEYESVDMLTSGVNVGIPIGQSFVLNLTAYKTDNLDSSSDYWTLGGSADMAVSDSFALTVGANTVTELDDFESTTYHLGATWRY